MQCFKGEGNPRRTGYTWMSRRQGVTVAQGELGLPGRLGILGDAFETL
jgi:hypothetical protein